ncbi:BCCT family transporter [Nocardioides sp. AE5]|uniref:BCCT family transporter n=1 Tax=Nocardioides sp. AE5 TaxID=2962573 RepID=UPI0028822A36|nr:BCCT family transporter [Nocardioides sp. AE5]MDT0203081.1 BCCT family transporter [Nocardioides sp. AE5]
MSKQPVESSQAEANAARIMNKGPGGIHPGVFYPAFGILLAATLLAIFKPDLTAEKLWDVQLHIVDKFGWFYVLSIAIFLIFSLWMGLSRFGDIRLGPDDEEPEFSTLAWFCMLFAAGMGIGLVFWGVAEPLTYTFTDIKPGVDAEGADLAHQAMAQVFLHWGFHAWAIYVVVGLALAYSIHRKGNPVSIRWALEPIFGDRVKGWIGDVIDTVAVVGTVAGVATSLGLGVQQIGAGLVHLGVFDEVTDPILIGLIVVITALATLSVVSGVGKGIKWLSNFNLGLAAIFVVVVLFLGPTLFLLRGWLENIGVYLAQVIPLTFDNATFTWDEAMVGEGARTGSGWQSSWTIFYWGWWVSWAPFVGVFIARISRGRTIRQFVGGVLLVPTMVTFFWFSVLGGSGIFQEMFSDGGLVGEDADGNPAVEQEGSLFGLLDTLPMSTLMAIVAVVLITIFFITSSDSGSLVVDMLASGGDPEPPTWSRVLWAVLEGAVAIALLLAGGLAALQYGAIIIALPFAVIMLLMCVAIAKELRGEHRLMERARRRAVREELAKDVGVSVTEDLTENFDEHFGEPVELHVEKVLAQHKND